MNFQTIFAHLVRWYCHLKSDVRVNTTWVIKIITLSIKGFLIRYITDFRYNGEIPVVNEEPSVVFEWEKYICRFCVYVYVI